MKLKYLVAALLVAGLSLVAAPSRAEGLRFLPVLQPGYTFAPTLAVSAGVFKVPDANHDADLMYGVDFNFNCLLMQTPENHMRTHLQVNRTEKSGLQSTSLELSPRYTLPVGAGFAFGLGPVLALVMADSGETDANLFGYGAVAGPEYRWGKVFAGLDVRYLATTKSDGADFENWAFLGKLGFNF